MGDGEGPGWPAAQDWYAACWARLGDGEKAYELFAPSFQVGKVILSNFFSVLWGDTFQIDGNLAGTALIAEMLLQSGKNSDAQGWFIDLLPALLGAWSTGEARGLRTRGGFEVDMAWQDGILTHGRIRSKLGNRCRLRLKHDADVSSDGIVIATGTDVGFETAADGEYVIGESA